MARIQLYNGRREGDPTWRACVAAYLEGIAAEKGFTIRAAGVIDIGAVRPLRATWKSDPALK